MTHYGMDPGQVERWITPRTKAIVPVHYAGHSAEMDGILEIANRHGIPVLEDAAESHHDVWTEARIVDRADDDFDTGSHLLYRYAVDAGVLRMT